MARRLFYILWMMVLLCGCSRHAEHVQLLAEAEQQNLRCEPFTTDSVARQLVDYFDRHGSRRERVRAHYILGCAQRDLDLVPQALDAYQDALDLADTTRADCDFKTLSRVYGQMADIYKSQILPNEMLKSLREASRLAWKAGDTLAYIIFIDRQYLAHNRLNQTDSAIIVLKQAGRLYSKYGYLQDYAISNGPLAIAYCQAGKYAEAEECFDVYEKESGLFNLQHQIEQGREIYYYYKGLYWLGTEQLDSAELCFRCVMADTANLNQQEAGNRGLYLLYKKKAQRDSIAKYADKSYQINDARALRMSTEEVSHITALYDYSCHQKMAQQEQRKATRAQLLLTIVVAVFILFALAVVWLIQQQMMKRRAEKRRYRDNLEKMKQKQDELERLKKKETAELIAEKTKEITDLSRKIRSYEAERLKKNPANLEARLRCSAIFQSLRTQASAPGQQMTGSQWDSVEQLISTEIPSFRSVVNAGPVALHADEYRICMLVRLHFSPFEICNLMGIELTTLSAKRRRMCEKVLGHKGSAKEFDSFIMSIS